jgi:hypothetical protein
MSHATAGFLGKEVYVVITTRVPGAEITPDDMRDHLSNQVALEKEGIRRFGLSSCKLLAVLMQDCS